MILRLMRWLHTQWPAGKPEKLPVCDASGNSSVAGIYIVGDLTGIPLLKFAADAGVRAVQSIMKDSAFRQSKTNVSDTSILDVAIIGGGVSGIAAGIESQKHNLKFRIYEAVQEFSTLKDFPKRKPIYTYPSQMIPQGDLQFHIHPEQEYCKEELISELDEQLRHANIQTVKARVSHITKQKNIFILVDHDEKEIIRAHRVIVAIGRSGNFRTLGCPGEHKDKVYNRLHDPGDFVGKNVLVIGGGDSALEASIALASCGAKVTLSYRKKELSRPKPENLKKLKDLQENPHAKVFIEQPTHERVTTATGAGMRSRGVSGGIQLSLGTSVKHIHDSHVELIDENQNSTRLANDVVFTMIGREPPLDFFRRSKLKIHGEWSTITKLSFALFLVFCIFIYLWKGGTPLNNIFQAEGWFPYNIFFNTESVLGISLRDPGFYYSLVYCLCVVMFGFRRIYKRKTPYIKVQTLTLMIIQVIPLFVLPYIVLPMMGSWGCFDAGPGKTIADNLFPLVAYGHGREYWRAFGFILAWPLFIWNIFTEQPLWWWLGISFVQTFVIIPLIIWRWGKGAYCGWICSCGALAETMGDTHRHKMPHGPRWNRVNMTGQVILWFAFLLLLLRIISWITPHSHWGGIIEGLCF